MKLSNEGIKFIQELEGLRLKAYKDSAGIWTIGYGHIKDVYQGMTCTKEQADQWFREDEEDHSWPVGKYITTDLTQNQYDALVSFTFNCGAGAMQRLSSDINTRNFSRAMARLLTWRKAGGKVVAGLVRRRQLEKDLFERGIYGRY